MSYAYMRAIGYQHFGESVFSRPRGGMYQHNLILVNSTDAGLWWTALTAILRSWAQIPNRLHPR